MSVKLTLGLAEGLATSFQICLNEAAPDFLENFFFSANGLKSRVRSLWPTFAVSAPITPLLL